MSGEESVLEADGVRRALGGASVLDGASIAIRKNRITALLGPSGSGKSTLVRVLAGLEQIDAGEVRAGQRLLSTSSRVTPPEKRGVGVVFQDYALFPHLNARANVAFGLSKFPARQRKARANELLEMVALAHRADAFPHELSGGEQQRVALARALAPSPRAILMDEPFSNLDGELRRTTRDRAKDVLAQAEAAALIVTHDVEEAMALADELALMSEGRVIQTGAPAEVYLNPVSAAAARLTGEVNIWSGSVTGGRLRTPFADLAADGLPDGATAAALVRPEGASLVTGGDLTVVSSRPFGAYARIEVAPDVGAPIWCVRAPVADAPQAGERVSMHIEPAYARVCAV